MPEALTYDSLISDVQLYAERNDAEFLAQIPRFVMLAENRLSSEVKSLGFIRATNLTLTANDYIYEKPARWRQTASLSILTVNDRSFLKQRSFQYLQTYWPNSVSVDVPTFYSDYDYEHFVVAPTPDLNYSATLLYYERPLPLDSTNQTNWTTQYAPQLLLYATLLEAQPFLKMPERIQEFQVMYDRALAAITNEEVTRSKDSSIARGPK